MIVNSQFRYSELMRSSIQLTDHFRKRYKERVSKKSGRASEFTKSAYALGKDIDEIEDNKERKSLQQRIHDGRTCKIYRGFVFIFELNRAITVFPISYIKSLNKECTI